MTPQRDAASIGDVAGTIRYSLIETGARDFAVARTVIGSVRMGRRWFEQPAIRPYVVAEKGAEMVKEDARSRQAATA